MNAGLASEPAFRADAKCADERAEWFKKLAEELAKLLVSH